MKAVKQQSSVSETFAWRGWNFLDKCFDSTIRIISGFDILISLYGFGKERENRPHNGNVFKQLLQKNFIYLGIFLSSYIPCLVLEI